jgi:porin
VEAGWTPGFDRRSTDRLQLTYWHKDRLDDQGTPEGAGWLLSYSMKVRERWVPFVRAGWSDGGGGALAKRSVAAGFSYQMAFQDWLTFGVGWNKPSDKTHGEDLASEKALETSYLWQVTANTSFLADVQVILDPAQNPDKDSVWMGGMRLRLTF